MKLVVLATVGVVLVVFVCFVLAANDVFCRMGRGIRSLFRSDQNNPDVEMGSEQPMLESISPKAQADL